MSTSGHLKFQGTNRATFVGTTSNIMFDTTSTSLGIGVTGTDHPSSNLYITGNAYVSSNIAVGGVLTMGTVNVVARHDLEAVSATGNITPLTIEFTNPTTSLVASGNVEVTGNVTAGSFLGDGSELTALNAANIASGTLPVSRGGTGTTSSTGTGALVLQNAPAFTGDATFDTNTLKIDAANNRVGIGTSSPSRSLHITHTADDNDLLWLEPKTTSGDDVISGGIQFRHGTAHQTGYRGITWHSTNQNFLMGGVTMAVGSNYNNCRIAFHAARSRINGGDVRAYIDSYGTGGDLNFTGQHRTFIDGVPTSGSGDFVGLIVSANNNKYIKMSGGIEAGSNAIMINESLPIVSLSNVVHDKACFGVISDAEDPETREDSFGNFTTVSIKEKGDTRVYINSVGEGAIWVSNIGGSLESGDYITTSTVKGYGQKQDDDILHNYTVAKITMDCDFDPVTQPVQVIKKDEDGENVLDEHGQIQWEDHPTETEKSYKIRYLDASGVETDEANAVHKAAFVGCTYHCG